MPIVSHTFVDDAGVPVANEWVRVTLVSRTGWWADGTRKASRVHSDQTDANGYWERNLPANVVYEEIGTFYRVERGTDINAIEVPNGAGPYTLRSIIRDPIPVDAVWKVTPRLEELLGATGLATAADGNTVGWNANTKTWNPVSRVSPSDLSTALAPLATSADVLNKNNSQDTQITALTSRVSTNETVLGGKASSSTVSALDTRVGAMEPKVSGFDQRIKNLEGGGSGGQAAPLHSGLRGLQTDPTSGAVTDDHPQYLNQTRGDQRYYPRTDADTKFAALAHAARHKTGAADALAPADIGASASTHTLDGHVANGQIVPALYVKTADATATNFAHAVLLTDIPADATPRRRSVRQGVLHPIDSDIADTVIAGNNLLLSYDFTVREDCDLWATLTCTLYLSAAAGQAVGTTGEARISLSVIDVASGGRVFTLTDYWTVNAGCATYDVRPTENQTLSRKLPGTYGRGKLYRLRLTGAATAANAPITATYFAGALQEIASLTG